MRILTILMGILFMSSGVYLVANGGLTFMSVAFVIGVLFVVAGIIECLSYSSYRGDNEERSWILTDGTTTFILGVLILLNKFSSDEIVPLILGLWVLTTGIRNFVHAWEQIEDRTGNFYDHLVVGLFNLLAGLYTFFDNDIFNLTTLTTVGICIIVQGTNLIHVGATIKIVKPDFLKTKEEKLREAAAKAEEAHAAAKEAIKVAKEAKAELKVVKATPEEQLDIAMAPRPGEEKPAEAGEKTEEPAGQSAEQSAE